MKKPIALLLALMMSAFIFVSCGPDETPDDEVPPASNGGGGGDDVQPPAAPGSDNAVPDGDWDLLKDLWA